MCWGSTQYLSISPCQARGSVANKNGASSKPGLLTLLLLVFPRLFLTSLQIRPASLAGTTKSRRGRSAALVLAGCALAWLSLWRRTGQWLCLNDGSFAHWSPIAGQEGDPSPLGCCFATVGDSTARCVDFSQESKMCYDRKATRTRPLLLTWTGMPPVQNITFL